MELHYDYATCVENSEKVSWRLDEVLPPDARFDKSRAFLPEALAPTKALGFLSDDERRALNQVTCKAYMNLFGYVEVYIEAMVLEHAQAALFGDRHEVRALARFADEEVKHQLLFERFCQQFDEQFGHRCGVLDNAAEIAQTILSMSELCVLLTTLHLELMTQQHYTECVRSESALEPHCAEILRRHWLEESQHARIDALLLHKAFERAPAPLRAQAFEQYLGVVDALDGLLHKQAALDVPSLAALTGRALSEADAAALVAHQHSGYRRTFVASGMRNAQFAKMVERLWPERGAELDARARAFEGCA